MIWSKTNGSSLLSGASEGGRVSETEERSEKYVLIKTIETDKKKTKRKKENKDYSFLVFSTTKFVPAPDQ